MKQIILATAVAMALSTTFAAAQSSQPQSGATGPAGDSANGVNGTVDGKTPRNMTTGSSLRATGGNAAAAGNNGNSMSGSNTITNPGNGGNIGSGR